MLNVYLIAPFSSGESYKALQTSVYDRKVRSP